MESKLNSTKARFSLFYEDKERGYCNSYSAACRLVRSLEPKHPKATD